MSISIGIFTAEPSMKNIETVTQKMESDVVFTYLPYTSMHHLLALYKELAYQFDGLLFSGILPYQYILSHLGAPQKPHVYFEVTDRDYYRVLLRLFYKYPGLDIRRVSIEIPFIDFSWAEIFGDADAAPQIITDLSLSANLYNSSLYPVLLERYLRMWRGGEVDVVVTRLTRLAGALQTEGIPFELLLPSPASMEESITKLIYEIQSNRMGDSLSAVGILQPACELSQEQAAQLQAEMGRFNRQQGMILILRQSELGSEIITSNNVLRDFTQSHQSCLLSSYLKERCDIPFFLGWGVGVDVIQAQQNAATALKESKRNKEREPYLVTELDELVGPLVPGKSITLSTKPDAEADGLAKKLNISPSNMQKLLTLQQRRGNLRLNRNELSRYLNVTVRTANRILKKLSETGAAQIVGTEQNAAVGRPMANYELNLDKLL